MTAIMTGEQLLRDIEESWNDLQLAIADLSESDLSRTGVAGAWSVKDILAHIAAWENRKMAWLAFARGEAGTQPEPVADDEAMHALNDIFFQASHGRPTAEIEAESRSTHERAVAAVRATLQRFTPEELATPYRIGDREEVILDWIVGNTSEHYAEHASEIRAWRAINMPH